MINKENSIWKKLYDNTIKLKGIRPWDYIDDGNMITVMLQGEDEPTWAVLIGKDEFLTAFCIMRGVDALIKYNMIHHSQCYPVEQMSRFNDNYICYFADRNDVPKEDYRRIKKLGLGFRGKKDWIFYRYLDSVYEPRQLKLAEAEYMSDVMEQLYYAILDMKDGLTVDFDGGKTMMRRFDKEQDKWITEEAKLFVPDMHLPVAHITDEILLKRLKKQEFSDGVFEFDIAYINSIISDDIYDRKVRARIAILSDEESGTIVNEKIMKPSDEDIHTVFDIIFGYILSVGKPQKIIVRDLFIYSMLIDTMHYLDIDMEMLQRLKVIDGFLDDLNSL